MERLSFSPEEAVIIEAALRLYEEKMVAEIAKTRTMIPSAPTPYFEKSCYNSIDCRTAQIEMVEELQRKFKGLHW